MIRNAPYTARVADNEQEKFASFLLNGEELLVSDGGGVWTVRYRGREVSNRFVDHALGEVLGLPPGSVLGLVQKLLTAEPGTELRD